MANSVKTAISLQEELFDDVNSLAKELHISRSKLFVLAVRDFMKKNENEKLLAQINQAFNDDPDPEEVDLHNEMKRKQRGTLEVDSW